MAGDAEVKEKDGELAGGLTEERIALGDAPLDVSSSSVSTSSTWTVKGEDRSTPRRKGFMLRSATSGKVERVSKSPIRFDSKKKKSAAAGIEPAAARRVSPKVVGCHVQDRDAEPEVGPERGESEGEELEVRD